MKILFTIDTEVGDEWDQYAKPFEYLVEYGVKETLKLLKKYKFTGHFFVDIYSNKVCDGKFDSVVQEIFTQGSKAYLHVHPGIVYDTKRPYLHQYSEEEQSSILDDGINEWKRITGKHPIGFRAGSYGADNTTLKLLKEKGFEFDSSYFKGRENCKITDPSIMKQIPVTSFTAKYSFFGLSKERTAKPDVNWVPLKSLKRIIQENKDKEGYMMIFLHSFSFGNLLLQRQRKGKVKEFEELLKFISGSGIQSVDDLRNMSLKPILLPEKIKVPISLKDAFNHFVCKQM